MQTILLTIWPFLNLLLFAGLYGAAIRYVSQFSKNRLYVVSATAGLGWVVAYLVPSSITMNGGDHTFVFQQPQPTIPLTNQAYHDGVLLSSPVFTIKSHVAVWPIKLPNTREPVEPESGLVPDALQTTLLIKATDIMPGLQWVPKNTSVRMLPSRKLVYETSGHITWRVLGFPVYNQPKEYIGYVKL